MRVRGSQVAQLSAVRRYAAAATAFGSFRSPPIAALIQDPSLDPDPPPGVLDHIQAVLPSLNSSTSFGTHLADTLFSLDREFTFINHGAFGAALRPLQREAEAWRQRSESQPLRFLDRELFPAVARSVRAGQRELALISY